ncbi:O-methyltransferase, family 3, S-adenosyl-L-methionine-dependent methyltransferase [Artemisia annua]|uniref:O-methyltransferase, family 3, S-adenosyl-L-methionine-dependent methyltransferase n=1 Tax=Artemisia annua TaxID=35608 RepID=A0A2U1P3Q9_ARTAN|nr:O-methyltransferase, family 3, S-adenosyl-L-methionine-dependent methyltransferase [Artemisia annua]
MTHNGLLQTEELYKYILETSVYPREHESLKEIRALTATHERSFMGTSPDSAQMMEMLLEITGAKKTLEIGVYTGYSLLLTALTIPDDGKIVAIDLSREYYEIGRPTIKKAGVEHKIDFIESQALPALDKLLEDPNNEGSFDFVFVDADKINYLKYHERVMKLVKINGIIVYDNTLWYGSVAKPEDSVPEFLKEGRISALHFNKALAADPRVKIAMAPLGDDLSREYYEIGRPTIKKAGVEHKIDFIESQALPALDKLLEDPNNEGSFDFVFVDADKINYLKYHERVMKLVKINGIIVYDNTLWYGSVAKPEDSVPEFLKEGRISALHFNKALAADPRVKIAMAPLGDGNTICRRLY